MNTLSLARGLLAAALLVSLAACGGGGATATPSAHVFAVNSVAAAANTGDVPTPSLRCAP